MDEIDFLMKNEKYKYKGRNMLGVRSL